MLTKKLKNQKGFTLIEIIAVLVILGILAAVAIPRFFAMQEDAQKAAIEGALAAGSSNLNLAYAKFLVNGGTNASIGTDNITGGGITQAIPTNLGDFTAQYTAGTTDCTITLTAGVPAWFDGSTATKAKTFVCPWNN
jgi:prepilin-type N-terminal cleavage/methylation domain-containing protein